MIEEAFEVVEAASADEAIAILEARLDITVVFTDIQMPGRMDGLKLAAAVRDRWPPDQDRCYFGTKSKLEPAICPQGGRFFCKSPIAC